MKTFTQTKASKAIQAALAALIATTGSVGAMAAVPEVPTIDWLDATVIHEAKTDRIEVDAGWSRYDLEDIYSVQYRVDGKPVITQAVEPGQTYGEATLEVDGSGDFEISIALCNVDGCSESDVIDFSVSDENEVAWSMQSTSFEPAPLVPMLTENSDSQCTSTTPGEAMSGMAALAPAQNGSIGVDLVSELGKAALSGLFRGGADFGIKALLRHLGVADDDLGAQLEELQSSVGQLRSDINYLTCSIEQLQDQTSWTSFLGQHTLARSAVNDIIGAFDDVVGWQTEGITPDTSAWTDDRSDVKSAMRNLAGTNSGGGDGIADSRDGAVDQLMAAIPQNVASVESYWTIIEEYRNYYRSAIALGFLTLDMLEDLYDGSGTTGVMANNAFEAGRASVQRMYEYGIAPTNPVSGVDTLDFVQLRGSTLGFASTEFADLDENTQLKLAGPVLNDAFSDMASFYRPYHHDDVTFEQFLKDTGVPTKYVVDSDAGWHSTGWQVTQKSQGTMNGGLPTWEVRPLVGEVRGNSWVVSAKPFCTYQTVMMCNAMDDIVATYSDSVIMEVINDRKAAIRANGGYKLSGNGFIPSHYGQVDLVNRLNHAGRPANFDADAVTLAAFGDGSARLEAGTLPGAEIGAECIGLPDEPTHLMDVEDFFLLWQPDGNLTLRNADNQLKWISRTRNNADELCWHEDGNLAIYNDGEVTFETDTSDDSLGGFGGRFLKLHQDGALQIVNELDDVLWWKGTTE